MECIITEKQPAQINILMKQRKLLTTYRYRYIVRTLENLKLSHNEFNPYLLDLAIRKIVTKRRVAQSVTYLATDASLTADPGVASSIPARSHTFVEIDHEIISAVILLPSAESFKKGCCQLQAKV